MVSCHYGMAQVLVAGRWASRQAGTVKPRYSAALCTANLALRPRKRRNKNSMCNFKGILPLKRHPRLPLSANISGITNVPLSIIITSVTAPLQFVFHRLYRQLAILPAESSSNKSRDVAKDMNCFLLSIFNQLSEWFLTCIKILHGDSCFTSPLKKDVLQIFIAIKNSSPWPGFNLRTLGPVACTLTITPPRRLVGS
jgi:hypothetical protein